MVAPALVCLILFFLVTPLEAEEGRFLDTLVLYEFRDGPVIPESDFPRDLTSPSDFSDATLRSTLAAIRFQYLQDHRVPGLQVEYGQLRYLSISAGGFYVGKTVRSSSFETAFELSQVFDLFGDLRFYPAGNHRGIYAGLGAMWSYGDLQLAYRADDGTEKSYRVQLSTGGGYGILGVRVPLWRFVRLNGAVLYYPQVRMTTIRLGLGAGW